MHIVISKKMLAEGIKTVKDATTEKNTQMEILKCILVQVGNDSMTLTAFNAEMAIRTTLHPNEKDRFDILQVGSIAIPEKALSQMVNKLRGEHVEIKVDHEKFLCHIQAGKSKYEIGGLDPENYPKLPSVDSEKTVVLAADHLKSMLRHTLFAAATSETRPILTGVHFYGKDGQLRVQSTDSHRLALQQSRLEDADLELEATAPAKWMEKLEKILPNSSEKVTLSVAEQLMVTFGETVYISRLLNGAYPDTARIIPTAYSTRVVLKVQEFFEALDSINSLLDDGKGVVIRFTYKADESEVQIYSQKQDKGKGEEFVGYSASEGEDIIISFSAKYMLEAVRTLKDRGSEEFAFEFTGKMSPFLLREVDCTDYVQLVLPIRTY